MSDHQHNPEADLSKLYQQRKSAQKAPYSVRRKILLMAQRNRKKHSLKINFFSWASGISVAAAITLLITLIALQRQELQQFPHSTQQIEWVEIHSLNEEYARVSADTKIKYEQNYAQYLSQQQTFARHHGKVATLNLLDEGWELTTCDEKLVKISAQLVQALSNLNKIERQLKSGDWVDISFNQDGRIIAITHNEKYQHC